MSAMNPSPMSVSLGSASAASSPTPSAPATARSAGLLDVGPMSLSAYSSSFCAFVERSSEYPAMHKLIDQMVAQRYRPSSHGRGLRFLSVGGGDGSFDFEVMLRMRSAGIVFESYTCVEPSDDRFPQLAVRYGATPQQVAMLDSSNAVVCFSSALNCTARLVKEYFNEHTQISAKDARMSAAAPAVPERDDDGGFDLVLMSHCFYWFMDPTAVALHALSLVSHNPSDECVNGGNVIIFHQSTRDGICAFFDHFTSTRIHFVKRPLADHGLGGQKLHSLLKEKKVDADLFEDYSAVDFTDAIVGGDRHVLSELISFFIQTPFQDLPADIQKEMEEFVRSRLRWRVADSEKDKSKDAHGQACEYQHDTTCLVLRQSTRKA